MKLNTFRIWYMVVNKVPFTKPCERLRFSKWLLLVRRELETESSSIISGCKGAEPDSNKSRHFASIVVAQWSPENQGICSNTVSEKLYLKESYSDYFLSYFPIRYSSTMFVTSWMIPRRRPSFAISIYQRRRAASRGIFCSTGWERLIVRLSSH